MYVNQEPTKLIIEHAGDKIQAELAWDVSMYDLLNAFYGICVAHTYHPEGILRTMDEWVKEKMEGMRAFELESEELKDE